MDSFDEEWQMADATRKGYFMACHLQPHRYLKILAHARCHQWWWFVAASFWIVATPKLPSGFTTWMRVAFFLHSQIVRSTVQQLHFSREVPRAKARQQLREAQNNDASRGLGEETGWLCGGARFKIHLTHYFKYFIHRGEIIPMHCNLFSLNPQKTSKNHPTMGIQ